MLWNYKVSAVNFEIYNSRWCFAASEYSTYLLCFVCFFPWEKKSCIRHSIWHTLPHPLLNLAIFSKLLVGGTVALSEMCQICRHRKGARALVRLRQWGFHTVLSSILLANVYSPANKMDELLFLIRNNKTELHNSTKQTCCFVLH